MNEPFSVGDLVRLANPNTEYRLNGVPKTYWDRQVECTVVQVMNYDGEIAAYHLDIPGYSRNHHMVHSMLSSGGGPW